MLAHNTATGAINNMAILVPSCGGRVGIGTSSPSYAVHIASSTSDDRALNIAQTGGGTMIGKRLVLIEIQKTK